MFVRLCSRGFRTPAFRIHLLVAAKGLVLIRTHTTHRTAHAHNIRLFLPSEWEKSHALLSWVDQGLCFERFFCGFRGKTSFTSFTHCRLSIIQGVKQLNARTNGLQPKGGTCTHRALLPTANRVGLKASQPIQLCTSCTQLWALGFEASVRTACF